MRGRTAHPAPANENAAQGAALGNGGLAARGRQVHNGQNLWTTPRPKVLEPVVPFATLAALSRPP